MQSKIPIRNHAPHGWWVATYILRAAWDDQAEPVEDEACCAWENTILVQADHRETAYSKAQAFATEACTGFEDTSDPTRKGKWVLEGLTSLLPIYEEFEDGAEIIWTEYASIPVQKIRSWIRPKERLEAFDDTPGRAEFG
ncbi:DUF4288 domain-containing protein [Ralstonia solanacearum]|uniref:DUF4288 domain-containing protein n=1 Tax=Ralstonia solanacearum TaxID=305 RepID=UPI0023052337|nr:DUF4288 domain-containing protein [Ralstonia solanacearum]MDB0565355.1 DUF4288 domain-containing protein [Ralstonia solanacearum]MDB0574612.1 DUF4288 domain-containing protein [Ralstonia solanacearum]